MGGSAFWHPFAASGAVRGAEFVLTRGEAVRVAISRLPCPPFTHHRLAVASNQRGVLLVVEAVICGSGRLGSWFGIALRVVPDVVVFAKGVTSGYVPLGGVVVHERVAEPFWADGAAPFRHGATYGGHPTACAAALANVLERKDLPRALVLEGELAAALGTLADHPLVTEVRADTGVLGALDSISR